MEIKHIGFKAWFMPRWMVVVKGVAYTVDAADVVLAISEVVYHLKCDYDDVSKADKLREGQNGVQ